MNNKIENINEIPLAELPDKIDVIGVSFRDSGKVYHFDANGITAKEGTNVVVETARGIEYGKVTLGNTMMPKVSLVLPLKKVLRCASAEDDAHLEENSKKEEEAFKICQKKIAEHELDMKLIDVEYTFDNAKLLFYFTSDDRVDFRDLVKDLAAVFKTRIELRQIGIRDETKLMGGFGVCYRDYCCHSFLSDFTQVSIKMAKEQGLSLNSAKISGACGRLMCCLRFEHETYQEEIARTPKVGAAVVTPSDGTGTVVETKPLLGLVKVQLDADPEGAPRVYDRELLRAKTDQDETTKKGEKIERNKASVNVPFVPVSRVSEETLADDTPKSILTDTSKRVNKNRQQTKNKNQKRSRPAEDEVENKSESTAKNAPKAMRSERRRDNISKKN